MSEVKQIAGRAGRKGMYDQGYVNSIEDRDQIGELLHGRYEQITSCVIQPPRKVLDMPYSLSEIFKIWLKTIEKKCFSVADLKNRIKLAEYIEKSMVRRLIKISNTVLLTFHLTRIARNLNICGRILLI